MPTSSELSRTIDILEQRLNYAQGLDDVAVVAQPPNHIVVHAKSHVGSPRRAFSVWTGRGELRFYDWEANVVPNPALRNAPPGEASFPTRLAATKVAEEHPGSIVVEKERVPEAKGPTGFFVIHDRPALNGADITDPKQDFDVTNYPDITFAFTPAGRVKFQALTREVADRGRRQAPPSSGAGPAIADQYSGHFAIVVDRQVLSRPIINFVDFPNGIDGSAGAEITGGLDLQEARDLAKVLELGPLPVRLTSQGVQGGTETASVTNSTP
jgi:preprotein translocase subunit SecD